MPSSSFFATQKIVHAGLGFSRPTIKGFTMPVFFFHFLCNDSTHALGSPVWFHRLFRQALRPFAKKLFRVRAPCFAAIARTNERCDYAMMHRDFVSHSRKSVRCLDDDDDDDDE